MPALRRNDESIANDITTRMTQGSPTTTDSGSVTKPLVRTDARKRHNGVYGRTIGGRYRVGRRIGIGGMAVVYEATDERLDRQVAIKMMLPQYAEDESFTERFYLEAKSAAKLQSPNIVAVHDWGLDEPTGTYYIVMELLDGTDLKHGIIDHAPFPCKTTAEIAKQVCNGLRVAHGHDIIHRDIKPQNIMVQPDGNIKVMDFGIARPSDAHLTTSKGVLGTAQYISPEQTRGMEVSPASDIYSLGIVMYECVTGRLPFDGKDAVTVALKQVRERPVPPSEICGDVDAVMEGIIIKCMAKSPDDRFESAQSLHNALDAYVQGKVTGNPIVNDTMTAPMPIRGDVIDGGGKDGIAKKDANHGGRRRVAIVACILAALLAGGVAFYVTNGFGTGVVRAVTYDVPNVVGLPEGDAKKAITEAGFVVGEMTDEYSDDIDTGLVVSQSPDGTDGKRVRGTSIDIVVSKGKEPPKTASVPSLAGMTQDEASTKLKELGFEVSVTYGNSDTIANGKVMDQSPAGNTTLQVGSTVMITVSKGMDTVEVPSVVGMTRDEARKALEEAGLSLGTVSQSSSDTIDKGKVMSQETQDSADVKRGTAVNVTVSTGRETVNVGALGLVGKSLAEAKNALNSYDVTVTVHGNDSLDSIVQNVSPTTIEKGGDVTVTTTTVPKDKTINPDDSGNDEGVKDTNANGERS